LARDFRLIKFDAFLLLDALGRLVSGGGTGRIGASLTFFSSWTNEQKFKRP